MKTAIRRLLARVSGWNALRLCEGRATRTMTTALWLGLAASLVAATGCVSSLPISIDESKDAAPVAVGPPRGPVRGEQVTAQNARRQAQVLWDELDREAQGSIASEGR